MLDPSLVLIGREIMLCFRTIRQANQVIEPVGKHWLDTT